MSSSGLHIDETKLTEELRMLLIDRQDPPATIQRLPKVNEQAFPVGSMCCDAVKATPVYGSLWRWLMRKPRYWEVSGTFQLRGGDEPTSKV